MRWLVENGARHSPDLGGVHPISLACNTVDEPILIETLIELGADVNVANKLGRTPLFSAAAAGLSKIIPVLLKAGASLLGLLGQTQSGRAEASVQAAGIDVARVEALIEERRAARTAKDWAASDRVRDALLAMGVAVKDSKDGTTTWSVVA